MIPLAPILQEYFTAYLVTQRAMSEATIRAYRDTWRLFLTFLSRTMQVPAHQLQLTHLDPAHVVAFLDYLEHERRGRCRGFAPLGPGSRWASTGAASTRWRPE